MCVQSLSRVQLFATPSIVANQATIPLSMEFLGKNTRVGSISSSRHSQPSDGTCVSYIGKQILTPEPPGKPIIGLEFSNLCSFLPVPAFSILFFDLAFTDFSRYGPECPSLLGECPVPEMPSLRNHSFESELLLLLLSHFSHV